MDKPHPKTEILSKNAEQNTNKGLGDILHEIHQETLEGESYEQTKEAYEKVQLHSEFRRQVNRLPFRMFHELIEGFTIINRMHMIAEQRAQKREEVQDICMSRLGGMSPRVADMFLAILGQVQGESYTPKFPIIEEKMKELVESGDLELLVSGEASWELKLNRIESRLTGFLLGLRALDRREGNDMDEDEKEWRRKQIENAPTKPPQRRKRSKPGVDSMSRLKEGEHAPAVWSINPAWGGYFREQAFSTWDSVNNEWVADESEFFDVEFTPENKDTSPTRFNITMSSLVYSGEYVSLPIPYTHSIHKVEADGKEVHVKKDENGDILIYVEGDGEDVKLDVVCTPDPYKVFRSVPSKVRVPQMPTQFSDKTEKALEEIKSKKKGNLARARAIAGFVKKTVSYLAPKDDDEADHYNNAYETHPNGLPGAVDELKQADCDVANTYFAALCAKLNIPVRHVVGHSVKGKDNQGTSRITSGTGHAWSEVWNTQKSKWERIDATPPGDPNLDEEENESGESAPGDYSSGDEVARPSDEKLEELRSKLEKRKEELSYTREERYLSEKTGVVLSKAREIVKEIHEAEATLMPNGERVTDILTKLFNVIVESRKSTVPSYDGPIRLQDGGERITELVRHKIGILSKNFDPASRERPELEQKEEKIMGGFDVYIIGDKSGSMNSTDESGEGLWQIQRRAMYLILSALHNFERSVERAHLQKKNELSIRTQSISFRGVGENDIDLDKPLSERFKPEDKVRMWDSLTEASGGNGDSAALGVVYEQISQEISEIQKKEERIIGSD